VAHGRDAAAGEACDEARRGGEVASPPPNADFRVDSPKLSLPNSSPPCPTPLANLASSSQSRLHTLLLPHATPDSTIYTAVPKSHGQSCCKPHNRRLHEDDRPFLLHKKIQLAPRVGLVDKTGLVEPCFAIVGHETHVYLAYMASEERDAVHILGPEVGSLGL
jgi:hypothetical protein